MARRSPFPGMDPWLEQSWGDVHARLINIACDQIQERLGGELVARIEERVYIESPLREGRQIIPDVHVYEPPGRRKPAVSDGGVAVLSETTTAEPNLLRVPAIEVRETFVEIRNIKTGGEVVTVIEFVSHTNKTTKVGRKKYLEKQRGVVDSAANLVEVDLLRGGRRVTLASEAVVPVALRSPYHACVRRAVREDVLEYYNFALRQRLPAIRVPLRKGEPDVRLDLQALVDDAYRKGRYEVTDYSIPPVPPLDTGDAEWARGLVQAWASPAVPGSS